MRRLWRNNHAVLSHLYALDQKLSSQGGKPPLLPQAGKRAGAASFADAYRMFFVQTVAVPPNNVRPLSKMGEMTFEHPQNLALTQVQMPSGSK